MSLMRQRAANATGFIVSIAFAVYAVSVSPSLTLVLVPRILHDVIMAIAFLTREPARNSVHGILPRVVAYGRTYILFCFVTLAGWYQPEWLAPNATPGLGYLALILVVYGAVLDLWALWHLRIAFSIEPQARRLITTGPYRFLRHPLYTSYVLSYSAILVLHPTVPVALAIALWAVFLSFSILYEEQVLSRAFPAEYQAYRERAGAILPRVRQKRATLDTLVNVKVELT